MKFVTLFLCLFISAFSFAQTSTSEEIKERLIDLHDVWDTSSVSYPQLKTILKDVEIVMLGEQTHHDGTTFATKVKLIEFLHREMNFDILAFESGFYDCKKAWQEIEEGARIDSILALSIFGLWSETNEFIPLTKTIAEDLKSNNQLEIAGFDNQFTGKTATTHFIGDFKTYLSQNDIALIETAGWQHFENTLRLMTTFDYKALGKNDSSRDTIYVNSLIEKIQQFPVSKESSFWMRMMYNLKAQINGSSSNRDFEMALNLIWLKEQNPGKKIICWGATSHFLYNSQLIELADKKVSDRLGDYYQKNPSMGNYVKEKYGDKLYTIGFIANEGNYYFGGSKKLDPAKEQSLEGLLATMKYNNCFLPFEDLTISPLESRPLGYYYMSTDISKVMDGVIFNRKMQAPGGNFDLVYELHPEYKWSQKRKKKLEKQEKKNRKKEAKEQSDINVKTTENKDLLNEE